MRVRLQKYLAEAGVASRRASEQIILEGRVSVNGETIAILGTQVDPDQDTIKLDGRPLKLKRKLYVALNKPKGYICSRKDDLNRRTVLDLLPLEWSNLYPVGRLDYESEGLIFLTNDGEFSLHLTHPRYGVRKKYLATVEGRLEPMHAQQIQKGLEHDGEQLKAERARILAVNNSHSLMELELAEGKNREVRRLFEALGFTVNRLQRIQIGKIKLSTLPVGKWRVLSPVEVKTLVSPAPERPRKSASKH